MRNIKLIIIIIFFFGFLFSAGKTNASEGFAELRSTTGEDYRCAASYMRMLNRTYKILVSCRDLIYPPQPEFFAYMMWATRTDNGKPVKLGELGVGKAVFDTKSAFSNLYVTVEQNKGAKNPSSQVVMIGSIQGNTFLDRPTTPTPVPEGEEAEEPAEVIEAPKELSTREKLGEALRRAGFVIVLAVAALIGLIFVLTRPRT